jgi:hypothetical protein
MGSFVPSARATSGGAKRDGGDDAAVIEQLWLDFAELGAHEGHAIENDQTG